MGSTWRIRSRPADRTGWSGTCATSPRQDLADVLKWAKFSGAAWPKDGSGFFYSRFDQPKEGEALTAVNKFQKVYFHALGTPQDADILVFEKKDQPDWGFSADVTEDGRFVLVYQSEGTRPENRIFVKDLAKPSGEFRPFLDKFDAEYAVVGNDGDRFYVLTNKNAPRARRRDRPGSRRICLEDRDSGGAGVTCLRRRRWSPTVS